MKKLLLETNMDTLWTVYRTHYVQTSSYDDADFDREEQHMDIIAPDSLAAKFYANERLNSHGDIFDVLRVERISDECVNMHNECYTLRGAHYYVIFGTDNTTKYYKGPWKYEHQADKYANSLADAQEAKVVVHQAGGESATFSCGETDAGKNLGDGFIIKKFKYEYPDELDDNPEGLSQHFMLGGITKETAPEEILAWCRTDWRLENDPEVDEITGLSNFDWEDTLTDLGEINRSDMITIVQNGFGSFYTYYPDAEDD